MVFGNGFMKRRVEKSVQTAKYPNVQYFELNVQDLRNECTKRGLSSDGLKSEVAYRLVNDDTRTQLKPLGYGASPPPRLHDLNKAVLVANGLNVAERPGLMRSARVCYEFLSTHGGL